MPLNGPISHSFLPQKFFLRIAEQIFHERVGVHHLPGLGVENKDAVLRRFKQPPVTEFGSEDRLHTPRLSLLRPRIGLIRPRLGLLRPRIGLIRPRIGLIRSRIGLIRPRIGLIRPGIGLIGPRIGLLRLRVDLFGLRARLAASCSVCVAA